MGNSKLSLGDSIRQSYNPKRNKWFWKWWMWPIRTIIVFLFFTVPLLSMSLILFIHSYLKLLVILLQWAFVFFMVRNHYPLVSVGDQRADILAVMTLQSVMAGYIYSVTKETWENDVSETLDSLKKVIHSDREDDQTSFNFRERTQTISLIGPKRMAIYILVIQIIECPLILLKSDIVVAIISWNTFPCMILLCGSLLVMRLDLYQKALVYWAQKLIKFKRMIFWGSVIILVGFLLSLLIDKSLKHEPAASKETTTD